MGVQEGSQLIAFPFLEEVSSFLAPALVYENLEVFGRIEVE